jgi:mannose-6-phosphate isomerase
MKNTENDSIERLRQIELGKTSKLRLFIWKVRRSMRDSHGQKKDVLATESPSIKKIREVYRKIDEFTTRFFPDLVADTPRDAAITMLRDAIDELGYTVVDEDTTKPWGAFFRMDSSEAERFINEFFPGLDIAEAKLGRSDVELSPKFLLVAPGQRLSWQYHDRRAERWRFLSEGTYYRSHSDTLPSVTNAPAETIVQFDAGERHRLGAHQDGSNYTLVAEIWQHTDAAQLSEEADIVRLADDYQR